MADHYDSKRLHEIRGIVLKIGNLPRGQAMALIEQVSEVAELRAKLAIAREALVLCPQTDFVREDLAKIGGEV